MPDGTNEARDRLQDNALLDLIEDLAKALDLDALRPQIAACQNQLTAGAGVEVAVFGRFKAGKSSLLNHLAAREILPVGAVPLTAVVTRLRYGAVERAQVRFQSGMARAVGLSEIGLYIAERENPDNHKQVAMVEIELPSLKAFEPLQFVDTPGLGSALAHNTETAVQWLPNTGAALAIISCDAPLAEQDVALLDALRQHTPRIVLLLSKADVLAEPQREQVVSFVSEQLRRKWGWKPPIFLYSVRPEHPEYKAGLEQKVLFPLVREHAEAARQIGQHKLRALAGRTLECLQVALAASTQALSARQALRERLAEERRQFDLLRAELNAHVHEWSGRGLDWSLEQLHPVQRQLQADVTGQLTEQFAGWRLRVPALLEAWREWLRQFLNRELTGVSQQQRTMFCQPLERARQHLVRMLQAFHGRLAQHVQAALGVSLAPGEFSLQVAEPSAPPVDVAYAFDAAFSMVGPLIPLRLTRRPIQRVLLRKARWEVEKNLSRLAADWSERVAEGIGQLIHQAERQALDELTLLEKLAAESGSSAPQLKQAMDELRQFYEPRL